MAARLRKTTWALLILAFVCALILWGMISQMLNVAAVQESVERNWEITFGPQNGFRESLVPNFIDGAVHDYLRDRYAGVASWSNWSDHPPHGRNLDHVYLDRFHAMFSKPIREIHIYDPEGFRGDLGAALQRFPGLRRVTLIYNDRAKEAEWKLFCTRLRQIPELETLELGGYSITDEAIAPLAGHPDLRSIIIDTTGLSEDCLKTFTSIPGLTHLELTPEEEDGTVWLKPKVLARMNAALPRVEIVVLPP